MKVIQVQLNYGRMLQKEANLRHLYIMHVLKITRRLNFHGKNERIYLQFNSNKTPLTWKFFKI
jgi:hypothetical protein